MVTKGEWEKGSIKNFGLTDTPYIYRQIKEFLLYRTMFNMLLKPIMKKSLEKNTHTHTHTHTLESLRSTLETNTTLQINYSSLKSMLSL